MICKVLISRHKLLHEKHYPVTQSSHNFCYANSYLKKNNNNKCDYF